MNMHVYSFYEFNIYEKLSVSTDIISLTNYIVNDILNGIEDSTIKYYFDEFNNFPIYLNLIDQKTSNVKIDKDKAILNINKANYKANIAHELSHVYTILKGKSKSKNLKKRSFTEKEYQMYINVLSNPEIEKHISPECFDFIKFIYYVDPTERNARAQEVYQLLIQKGPGDYNEMFNRLKNTDIWKRTLDISTSKFSENLLAELKIQKLYNAKLKIKNINRIAEKFKRKLLKICSYAAEESSLVERSKHLLFTDVFNVISTIIQDEEIDNYFKKLQFKKEKLNLAGPKITTNAIFYL